MVNISNKILVVDDEDDLRELVKLYLTEEGYEVDTAVDGNDCLNKIGEYNPDLVLLDVMMPETHIGELIGQIQNTKIAFLTVVNVSKDEKNFLLKQDNIVDYIQKPFDVDDLITRVNKIMHKSKIDFTQELENKNLIMYIIPHFVDYNNLIVDVVKQLSGKKICYINFNKTYSSISELFTREQIDYSNFMFVDGITRSFKEVLNQNNCVYVDLLKNLDDISDSIISLLDGGYEYLIFDSVTNVLTNYDKDSDDIFFQKIKDKLIQSNCKGIFYSFKKSEFDGSSSLSQKRYPDISASDYDLFIEESVKFFDSVVDLEKIRIY